MQYGIIAVVAAIYGGIVNWAIYSLAYNPRPISPWSSPDPAAPPRRAVDRIPIVGWWGLRRERQLHGSGFWIRPLLIEFAFSILACGLYYYETRYGGLLAPQLRDQLDVPGLAHWMHFLFFCHLLLMGLMAAATFIDFDEQTVPDAITIPGTLLGFALAAHSVEAFLPVSLRHAGGVFLEPVLLTAPGGWSADWSGTAGLWLGLGLYAGWCFALADRRVILRRGFRKAVTYFFAGLVRLPSWRFLLALWVFGSLAILGVWAMGETHWPGLLSSLVGMAVGGGMVWAVRIVAGTAMAQEAMGFGDVTLMGMIGAFVGWQPTLIAFPLAPMTAILIVVVQYALTRNRVVAFGPYLCAGTVVTILAWDYLWTWYGAPAFALGFILPVILLGALGLMGAMLITWRWLREALFG
ncbi:prepilin peptidase [Candidatus Laterigemmans baculatus]|uniref:prepilin peptidase n=1 Tax=Candidatus Laterigemmans baculatus TaxID=2770505 RepID=UPI001F384F69|nr:A24 family peptidase [Candidatus Laterigemmans baculatus]